MGQHPDGTAGRGLPEGRLRALRERIVGAQTAETFRQRLDALP